MDVSADLTESVVGYYSYLWIRRHGTIIDEIFQLLPHGLRTELSHKTYNNIISQVRPTLICTNSSVSFGKNVFTWVT